MPSLSVQYPPKTRTTKNINSMEEGVCQNVESNSRMLENGIRREELIFSAPRHRLRRRRVKLATLIEEKGLTIWNSADEGTRCDECTFYHICLPQIGTLWLTLARRIKALYDFLALSYVSKFRHSSRRCGCMRLITPTIVTSSLLATAHTIDPTQ